MPIYEFCCHHCGETFEKMTSISARDAKTACPKCGSKKTGRKLSNVGVGKSATPSATPTGGHGGGCACCRPRGGCPMQ